MKKYLVFALAAGMLASCSKDNKVTNPIDGENNEQAMEIRLSAAAPVITKTSTRGVGSVGDLAGDNNKWNNNTVQIVAFDRTDAFDETPFLNKTATVADGGAITWTDAKSEYYTTSGRKKFRSLFV